MSITMHTALYQKSDETSQGLADFTTSVSKTHALSVPPLRLDLTRPRALFWFCVLLSPIVAHADFNYIQFQSQKQIRRANGPVAC